MSNALSFLTNTLRTLEAGERGWFWLCDMSDPPVIISCFSTDADMKKLNQQALAMEPSLSAIQCMGVVHVDDEGRYVFLSPLARSSLLQALAAWVQENHLESPELGILAQSKLVQLKREKIAKVYEDEQLWSGIERPVVNGTVAAAARLLGEVQEEQKYRFWICDCGPSQMPFLCLAPQEDPMELFLQQIKSIYRRSPRLGSEQQGIVTRQASGKLVFCTTGSTVLLKALINQLLACWAPTIVELQSLDDCYVASVTEQKITGMQAYQRPKNWFGMENMLLHKLVHKQILYFYFTAENGGALCLTEQAADLKEQCKRRKLAKNGVRGTLSLSSTGQLLLSPKSKEHQFVAALKKWAKSHCKDWPALMKFKNATIRKGG